MKRVMIALGITVVFGMGMLAGSLLLNSAQAQKPTVTENKPPAPGELLKQGEHAPRSACPYCKQFGQGDIVFTSEHYWSILKLPSPDVNGKTLTVLFNADTGESYRLLHTTNMGDQYSWVSIPMVTDLRK